MTDNKDIKEKLKEISTASLMHELEKMDEDMFWKIVSDIIARKTNCDHLIYLYCRKYSKKIITRVVSELHPKDGRILTIKLLRGIADNMERDINSAQNIAKC